MKNRETPRRELDRLLLLEVGLGLLLFGLAIYLYWIPAAREPFLPRPWGFPLLAALFFGILWLNRRRRTRRRQRELKEAVRDVVQEAEERGIERGPSSTPQPGGVGGRTDHESLAPPERPD